MCGVGAMCDVRTMLRVVLRAAYYSPDFLGDCRDSDRERERFSLMFSLAASHISAAF